MWGGVIGLPHPPVHNLAVTMGVLGWPRGLEAAHSPHPKTKAYLQNQRRKWHRDWDAGRRE